MTATWHKLLKPLALGVGLVMLGLAWNGGPLARAAGPTCTVCPGGCNYTTIQAAVDDPDCTEIKVAQGVYSGVQARPAPAGYPNPPASGLITQVVYISRTVIVRGGYSTTNWTTPYPLTQPTTLNASGLGRVLVVAGDISPTIEGLGLTNGNAAGLGGAWAHGGGGAYVISATASIRNCRVFNNSATYGGGLCLLGSPATLSANSVTSNTATYDGGGLLLDSSPATLISNNVTSNTASEGGGLSLWTSPATLSANSVTANTATSNGGGLYLAYSNATLTNTVVADNWAGASGSGLLIIGSAPRLLHTTIARNGGGDGSGLYLLAAESVRLTNTILVSQAVGIFIMDWGGPAATLLLKSTLWYGNGANWGGAGTIHHNGDTTGDPAFVDPDRGDYHIGPGSAAIDRGVAAGVATDKDGRPRDASPDLGAYEFPMLRVIKGVDRNPVQAGTQLTYTVLAANTLDTPQIITAFDLLPDQVGGLGEPSLPAADLPPDVLDLLGGQVSLTATVAYSTTTIVPGATWVWTLPNLTVQAGYTGRLTNTVLLTSVEGLHALYVLTSAATTSPFCTVCLDGTCDFTSIQAAVDAPDCTEIKVAQGVYSGVQARPVPAGYPYPPAGGLIAQVVYIDRTIALRGGYTTTNWATPDPVAHPTTLDARGLGRVLVVAGAISPTIEGLSLTNGNATGLCGDYFGGVGGGVYVLSATVTLSDCQVFSNTAYAGGGLYLQSSPATLISNSVTSNTASSAGGGLALQNSSATLSANSVTANTAGVGGGLALGYSDATLSANNVSGNISHSDGGGLALWASHATLASNSVTANTASQYGGGLYLTFSSPTLISNSVTSNTAMYGGGLAFTPPTPIGSPPPSPCANSVASNTAYANGLYLPGSPATLSAHSPYADSGGLSLDDSPATLISNSVTANTATYGGGLYLQNSPTTLSANSVTANTASYGGGLYLAGDNATLISNSIAANTAATSGGGLHLDHSNAALSANSMISNSAKWGGGLYLQNSSATLNANSVTANTATYGGGLDLEYSPAILSANSVTANTASANGGGLSLYHSDATLTNTVVADNRASRNGSGLYIFGTSAARLLHTTIARNGGGDGSGLYAYPGSAVWLTNTILVSHTVGITAAVGSTATMTL